MANNIFKQDIVDIELTTGNIHRSFLNRAIGMADKKADHFGVRVFRNHEPVDLSGVTVQGFFRDPMGNNIFISEGNIVTANVAEVVLPQACYNYDGQFCLAIKLVDGTAGVTGTMRIVDGMVDNTNTNSPVAPTGAVPTYQEIIDIYDEMVDLVAHTDDEVDAMWDVINTMKDEDVLSIAGDLNASISSSPAEIASHTYARLVYAAIDGYSNVVVRKDQGQTFVVAFTATTPADGIAVLNRNVSTGTEISTYVPDGAKYIAVYYYNTNSDTADIDAMRASVVITAYNDGTKDAVAREWIGRKDPMFNNDLTELAEWTDGTAINRTTGDVMTSQTYTKSTYFMNIEGASHLLYRRLYTTSSSMPTNGIAFYDSGKEFISGVASDYNAEERGGSYMYMVAVPTGACFVRFTYWLDSVAEVPFEAYDPVTHTGKIDSTAQMINEIIPNDNLLAVMAEKGRTEGFYISGQNKITAYGTSQTIEFPNNGYMMVRLQASEMGRTYIAFLAESIHGKQAGDAVTMATGETKRRELDPGQVGIFNVPADCTHIAISERYTTNRLPQNGVLIKQGAMLSAGGSGTTQNSWYFGKKMVVFGASSEAGSALQDPTKAYPYLVAQSLGMSLKVYAIGGSCCAKKEGSYDEHYLGTLEEFLADPNVDTEKKYFIKDDLYAQRPYGVYSYTNGAWTKAGTDSVDCARTPMVERLADIDEDADVIYFALSSNDWQYNWAPLGTEADYVTWTEDIVKSGGTVTSYHRDYHITTIESTLGAVSAIFAYLKTHFPDALIIIKMTGRRIQHTGEAQSTFDSVSPDSVNGYGVSFRQYVNALREACDYYGMNLIDFYRNGVNMFAMADPLTLFVDRDGKVVHLNEEGNRRAAVMVEKYLLSLR